MRFGKGGYLRPGLVRFKNTTGKPERVLGPNETRDWEGPDAGAGHRPRPGR